MNERKLYAIWQDNTVKGYIALTEEQRQAINNLPNAGRLKYPAERRIKNVCLLTF